MSIYVYINTFIYIYLHIYKKYLHVYIYTYTHLSYPGTRHIHFFQQLFQLDDSISWHEKWVFHQTSIQKLFFWVPGIYIYILGGGNWILMIGGNKLKFSNLDFETHPQVYVEKSPRPLKVVAKLWCSNMNRSEDSCVVCALLGPYFLGETWHRGGPLSFPWY